MDATTAALVGATGGAGTTRLAVETATLLADEGRDVAVLDAAFGTQGLSDHLDGRLDPDVTALVTDATDDPLSSGLVEFDADASLDGRVACCPARAPFERLARAKKPEAVRRFEDRIVEASDAFDAVVVDTPPVAANQAVAAVTAVDRVGIVAPATTRGADAVGRMRARLQDVDAVADTVVSTRGELADADASLPAVDAPAPAALDGGEFGVGVASAVSTLFGVEPVVDGDDGLVGTARNRL